MPRYLMNLCYDGTRYHGWQKQDNGISIQATMERALKQMHAEDANITAAGRTDAGVHALSQKAHFDYPPRMSNWQLVKAFNSLLPPDIKVLDVIQVSDDFHARFDACQRGYIYLLAKEPQPFTRLYMGLIPHKLIRFDALYNYLPALLGSHDFSSLACANPNIPKRICNLQQLDIFDRGSHLEFRFLADRFLHHMVRRIVGTVVNLAAKSLDPQTLVQIMDMADPKQTLVETAPPQGLYLCHVGYPSSKLPPDYPFSNTSDPFSAISGELTPNLHFMR